MFYEFILKYKDIEDGCKVWKIKYHNPKVAPEDYERVKLAFEKNKARLEQVGEYECLILINKLDDKGDFIEVVQ